MNVELDANTKKALDLLAQAEGKDPAVLLRELVREAIVERKRNGSASRDEDAIARGQHEEWERLDHELSTLPVSEKAAGFSGRDHDEVLYGWKKSE